MNDFASMFGNATGYKKPHDYQSRLACGDREDKSEDEWLRAGTECTSRLISIPTGMGKTAAVTLAWLWNRVVLGDEKWPRRLVYCLPMRTLVEQTRDEINNWLQKLSLAFPENADLKWLAERSPVILMGGEENDDLRRDWDIYPEKPAILIGTQDMLLSRALNRGYGMSRARWPMHFALLNNDCLWIMDEVQLMDVGLSTSAQLQAFRNEDFGKMFYRSFTWWMSATLQPDWLCSPETADLMPSLLTNRMIPGNEDKKGSLWDPDPTKMLCFCESALDEKALATLVATKRASRGVTLVIVNTVKRAMTVYDALKKNKALQTDADLHLIHSRFRPCDRSAWRDSFLRRDVITNRPRIIVATQVVEAGVDLSADVLITDLAPWAALVQRFGRAARYGGSAEIHVINLDEKKAAPYEWADLESARDVLQTLHDASIHSLDAFESALSPDQKTALYPYAPGSLLLRREVEDLFDTSTDLSGADLDISRFIRSGQDTDCQIAWLDLAKTETPSSDYHPSRNELCSVSIGDAKKFLEKTPAWKWDYLDRRWIPVKANSIYPGLVIVVRSDAGGYDPGHGFDTSLKRSVPCFIASQSTSDADAAEEDESLSVTSRWETIAEHGAKAANELHHFFGNNDNAVLDMAVRWHDFGKAHPAFQSLLVDAPSSDIAKAPASAWRRPPKYAASEIDPRPGFRHELASALAIIDLLRQIAPEHAALRGPWISFFPDSAPVNCQDFSPTLAHQQLAALSVNELNLLLYLVAAHHGKVRVALHASPADQLHPVAKTGGEMPIRGILEGDTIPPTTLTCPAGSIEVPLTTLTLAPAAIGLSETIGASWGERCAALLAEHGPFHLAYLETILRAADIRASRK